MLKNFSSLFSFVNRRFHYGSRRSPAAEFSDEERGIALTLSIFVLGLLFLLGMALAISAGSEIEISSSSERNVQALYIADAGINHAFDLLRGIDGDFTRVLAGADNTPGTADDGVLSGTIYPTDAAPIPQGGLSFGNGNYSARAYDDNDPQVSFAPPVAPVAEDGDYSSDINRRVVVRVTGTGPGGAQVVLDGMIGFVPYPAIASNGGLTITGDATIQGNLGSAHSNSNLTVSGSALIEQTATATGSYSGPPSESFNGSSGVGGFAGGDQPRIDIPDFKPIPSSTDNLPRNFFLIRSDVILVRPNSANLNTIVTLLNLESSMSGINTSQPVIINRTVSPPTVTNAASAFGWGWNPGSGGRWALENATTANNRTYFIDGDVRINGGNTNISVISTESISVQGNPTINSKLNDVILPRVYQPPFARINFLLLAGKDIDLQGTASGLNLRGLIYAREQIDLRGNGFFTGQVVSFGSTHTTGSPVSSNEVSGNFTLTLNSVDGTLGKVVIISWRQVKK